jgi:hypothetical protein
LADTLIDRIKEKGQQARSLLSPWLSSPARETGSGLSGRRVLAARQMRVIDDQKLGSLHPQKILSLDADFKDKKAAIQRMIHFTPGYARDDSIWSEVDQVYPAASASESQREPDQPGVMRAGTIIQKFSMTPKPGQSIESFKEQVSRFKPSKPVTSPSHKPVLPSKARLFSRIQEISGQKEPASDRVDEMVSITPPEPPAVNSQSKEQPTDQAATDAPASVSPSSTPGVQRLVEDPELQQPAALEPIERTQNAELVPSLPETHSIDSPPPVPPPAAVSTRSEKQQPAVNLEGEEPGSSKTVTDMEEAAFQSAEQKSALPAPEAPSDQPPLLLKAIPAFKAKDAPITPVKPALQAKAPTRVAAPTARAIEPAREQSTPLEPGKSVQKMQRQFEKKEFAPLPAGQSQTSRSPQPVQPPDVSPSEVSSPAPHKLAGVSSQVSPVQPHSVQRQADEESPPALPLATPAVPVEAAAARASRVTQNERADPDGAAQAISPSDTQAMPVAAPGSRSDQELPSPSAALSEVRPDQEYSPIFSSDEALAAPGVDRTQGYETTSSDMPVLARLVRRKNAVQTVRPAVPGTLRQVQAANVPLESKPALVARHKYQYRTPSQPTGTLPSALSRGPVAVSTVQRQDDSSMEQKRAANLVLASSTPTSTREKSRQTAAPLASTRELASQLQQPQPPGTTTPAKSEARKKPNKAVRSVKSGQQKVVQRRWEDHSAPAADKEQSQPQPVDLDQLAGDILPLVKRLLDIELERSSGRRY